MLPKVDYNVECHLLAVRGRSGSLIYCQGSNRAENSAGFVVENLVDLMRYKLFLYEISVMIVWNIANAESIQKICSYFKIRSINVKQS